MVLFVVIRSSILGTLLFNKFIYDLLMSLPKDDISNYADENTANSAGNGIHIISDLEQA